jgi:hypothetical protein
MIKEFDNYIHLNQALMLNYGVRYRSGLRISSSPAESAANALVNRWIRQDNELGDALVVEGRRHGAVVAKAREQWFLESRDVPVYDGAPEKCCAAEAQNAIRASNYSSSEVRAAGHIRNKTVAAATQTPAIRNHAGAREVDTEIPLFLLSNIRAPCTALPQD